MTIHGVAAVEPTSWQVAGRTQLGFVGRCLCGWEGTRFTEQKARRAVVGHLGGKALHDTPEDEEPSEAELARYYGGREPGYDPVDHQHNLDAGRPGR